MKYLFDPDVKVLLPDGSTRKFDKEVTVAEVAASIGAGLAKAAIAGRVGLDGPQLAGRQPPDPGHPVGQS